MALSAFAYILGVFELLVGIPLLFFPGRTMQWLLKLREEEVLVRGVGALFLTLSVLVLTEGVAVSLTIAGIVRLVAWLTAVKCLITCWWPQRQLARMERIASIPLLAPIVGLFAVAAGVLLVLAGHVLQ